MPKRSAGLLVHRRSEVGQIEVVLVHPGGPFWANKDDGAWSIPKGELEAGEDPLTVAQREFDEEIGQPAPAGPPTSLGEITQSGGKRVIAWAVEGDVDVSNIASNTFEMEWPPGSGQMQEVPEVDRAEWFTLVIARAKILKSQQPLLDRLEEVIGA